MGDWTPTVTTSAGGRFALLIHKLTAGGRWADVTTVRDAPTQLASFSSGDPFGDSAAVFSFPSITAFDDLDSPEFSSWLGLYASVELWWITAVPAEDRYLPYYMPVLNPLTQARDMITPWWLRDAQGNMTTEHAVVVWEGFVAALDYTSSESDTSLQLQCQGALFQADHYLQKPFYPIAPWPLEKLIEDVFSHTHKPHLRTQPLKTVWPAGWTKRVPAYASQSANVYAPVAKPGTLWSGLSSRTTGSWEHALTGFVQDQLSLMIVGDDCGVTPGNQFTIAHQHQATGRVGRQPVLMVRDRFRPPDFSLWLGAPGVSVTLSGDATQSENIIYGAGTDVDGAMWRNAVINEDGSRTDYLPLAASGLIYPARHNPAYSRHAFASESYTSFVGGFSQPDATAVAKQQLARDQQPGWTGTIALGVDPSPALSRWLIRAGQTVLLKGFLGSGERGVPFHIASVEAAPMEGTVSLTVDTRYRDLLTIGESVARTRDSLNPIRMLQVNKTSVMIEDVQAPWDYKAGSGFVPRACKDSYSHKPASVTFPYQSWLSAHPPLHHPSWYVKCDAANRNGNKRWAHAAILTSEAATIARSEFLVCDLYGRIVPVPFHVSIYKLDVTVDSMPHLNGGPSSPYLDGAFESTNPATGQPWDTGNFLQPDRSILIGWGNRTAGKYQRAGFSPGSESAGGHPTGLLTDDATWKFDNADGGHGDYNLLAKPGVRQPTSAITLYLMFYCEYHQPVYLQGRLYRQNQAPG